jgi:acetyl-CoA carboxylase biotin carboxylase subunit
MGLFDKILIANRGEIAVRVIRACKEMGIRSVAVYSEVDEDTPHSRLADEAILIGQADPGESYLSIERVIDAAVQVGADAVHPGYGFLAESAAFSQAVADVGLTFIGPGPEAIRAMGDKGEARERMAAAGVPVVPGYQGPDGYAAMNAAAEGMGYPVLIKAASGGGGRGMRVVWEPDNLPDELAAARREARGAFGDGRLILEKYLPRARHIEFQVFADHHGNTVHLFERECSIQRRHQKVVEETPSPLVDPGLRGEMGAAAVAAARAVGYENAGTVEFIVDPSDRAFYFLEMNTRLQVEHPITEMVTGLDLVRWQIQVAAGGRLPLGQEEIPRSGHAIECRLYAEDPADGFLPAAGQLLHFVPPSGPGVRVDAGVGAGDIVGLHYDPLIAKVIVHAGDRPAAIQRMALALEETVILGLTTNREFLLDLLAHPVFADGEATTTFIERHMPDWQPPEQEIPPEALIAAALSEIQPTGAVEGLPGEPDPYSPWRRADRFRLGGGEVGDAARGSG